MSRSFYHTVCRRVASRKFVAIRMSDYTEICRATGRTAKDAFSNLHKYASDPTFRFAFPITAKKKVDSHL
jgi:hypothetical protein